MASCAGIEKGGSLKGPERVKSSPFLREVEISRGLRFEWETVHPDPYLKGDALLADICVRVAAKSRALARNRRPFFMTGGDHSAAIGLWAGIMEALSPRALGLLWIDAHLDAHDFRTSPSGNVHGMPLAALLCEEDKRLAAICPSGLKIMPQNLAHIGARSFEPDEEALLKRLGVCCCHMRKIERGGDLRNVLRRSAERVKEKSGAFGISLDLDAVCPEDAPGVTTPATGGLSGGELCAALEQFGGHSGLVCVEIAEFNPDRDRGLRTERLIADIIAALI